MTVVDQIPTHAGSGEDLEDKKWSLDEYDRLVETGLLAGQHVQLIHGRVVQMSPQGDRHGLAIEAVDEYLRNAFPNCRVRIQAPIRFAPSSEPEPDLLVAGGHWRAASGHPSDALLVVEVSDKTLRFDRGEKAGLYAVNGIAEYWILNLVDRQLEVHRSPDKVAGKYTVLKVVKIGERIAPLAAPTLSIDPAELLPRV